MPKCSCYMQHGSKFLCYGTKEMEECSCGGDESKCNFYPEKRKQKVLPAKRLIDAMDLVIKLSKRVTALLCFSKDPIDLYNEVLQVIAEAPTVDTEKSGCWEEWWPGDCALIMTGEEMLYRCTICDAKYPDVEGFDFCPHCGTPMESKSIRIKRPGNLIIRAFGERRTDG